MSLILIAAIWSATMLTTQGATASVAGSSEQFTYVTIEAGTSLWTIAHDIAPVADPRDVIDQIVSLNQLSSTDVYPGEELAIPAQYAR